MTFPSSLPPAVANLQCEWPPVTSLTADFQIRGRVKNCLMEWMHSQQPVCLPVWRESGEGGRVGGKRRGDRGGGRKRTREERKRKR